MEGAGRGRVWVLEEEERECNTHSRARTKTAIERKVLVGDQREDLSRDAVEVEPVSISRPS